MMMNLIKNRQIPSFLVFTIIVLYKIFKYLLNGIQEQRRPNPLEVLQTSGEERKVNEQLQNRIDVMKEVLGMIMIIDKISSPNASFLIQDLEHATCVTLGRSFNC